VGSDALVDLDVFGLEALLDESADNL